jgi:phosphatidylserine/phosphatidylglycerophosphate/cardiolipin synthase-like enzyme
LEVVWVYPHDDIARWNGTRKAHQSLLHRTTYYPTTFIEQRDNLMSTPVIHGSYFSPNGGLEAATVQFIQAASATLDAAVYAFNDNPIAAAILAAAARGVAVRLLVDGHQDGSQNQQILRIANANIPVRCAFQYQTYHNKFIVRDSLFILTGSANFTYQANTANAENIVIIEDLDTSTAFAANFNSDWNGSLPYVPPKPHG